MTKLQGIKLLMYSRSPRHLTPSMVMFKVRIMVYIPFLAMNMKMEPKAHPGYLHALISRHVD